MLYARSLWLRNCGRFTHVSSDFGSQYYTHLFASSEALHAGMTRGVTWRHAGRLVDLEEDADKSTRADYFFCDYDVRAKPVWFTPGVFVDEALRPLPKRTMSRHTESNSERPVVDRHDFNVVDEDYPGTGGGGRPSYVPTYGRIEGVLPDHRLLTYAVSPNIAEISEFNLRQTFLLGKKRTMFQLIGISPIVESVSRHGECTTDWLQFPPKAGGLFRQFEILAATMRYVILRGTTREQVDYVEFTLPEVQLRLPDFYLERVPLER